jgi:hypothetical protein
MSIRKSKYVDLKTNGKLFPSWVMANFKKYKLPDIIKQDDDPCNRKTKNELRLYQKIMASFLDYRGPYRDILLYHGLGSGKTGNAINIYNMLYNYTPGWNVFILLRATLKDHPWMDDLQKFLTKEEYEFRFKNIIFISYDSPIADRQFMDAVKNADTSKRSLYIIEEAHNFIRNVYTNISSKQGRRAQTIYDYILQDKKENEGVRVVALSATPAVNTPYELALLFNLLRPGSFPRSEAQFNQMFLTASGFKTINPATKNLFQRRILGLVSYYIGSTPDTFASKNLNYVDIEMSEYQEDIYSYFEDIEITMEKNMMKKKNKNSSSSYKSYTRQSCNFVFPPLNQNVTGENRPRPNKFKISEKEAQKLEEGKDQLKNIKGSDSVLNVQKYLKSLELYINSFDDYLLEHSEMDKKEKHNILVDFENYKKYDNFNEFHKKEPKKSNLYDAMHKCSAKMICIIFNLLKSQGPVLVYSNYVLMEGLEIFKIYLKYFGFSAYENINKGKDFFRYIEYHGGISKEQRSKNIIDFNNVENITGKNIKIIMISPAGAEGLSLENTRQVHLMEPYWHEVRMNQMIGRAIRYCSHKNLPQKDRQVDVFRYKSIRSKNNKWTTDQIIEDLARSKDSLIQSFLDTLKEAAVDCNLFKSHNMMVDEYKCFQFEEPSLFDEQIGPAFKDEIADDMEINNGLNNINSQIVRIKARKISAVKQLHKDDSDKPSYSKPQDYWFNADTNIIYDFEMKYPIGKVGYDVDGLPLKLDDNTYIITHVIPIPMIEEVE